jgi:hypothetical protein
MNNVKESIGIDLEAWSNNLVDAGLKNKELSNNLHVEFVKQLFSLSSFYLIFIATLFFFLEKKLDLLVVYLAVKFWLCVAIISTTLSIITGLVALFNDRRYLLYGAEYYRNLAMKVKKYIHQIGAFQVKSIPDDLKIDQKMIAPWGPTNWIIGFQCLFFAVSIIVTIIIIIGSIIL